MDRQCSALCDLANRLETEPIVRRVYMFGSSSEDPRQTSDIDLLVVTKTSADSAVLQNIVADLCQEQRLHKEVICDPLLAYTRAVVPRPGLHVSHCTMIDWVCRLRPILQRVAVQAVRV